MSLLFFVVPEAVFFFCLNCVFLCVQTEPAEVKVESERSDTHDVTLPMSIIYNDNDTLAHPTVSSHLESLSLCFKFSF